VPGILYGNVGSLAGFFVFMTTSVFVLLALKYAEVTHRFPQGGGVVTVAAQAMNHWVGALGGMFILVDYFLTAAISSISGILYLSVVFPEVEPFALATAVGDARPPGGPQLVWHQRERESEPDRRHGRVR
jgi:amino acid transporter